MTNGINTRELVLEILLEIEEEGKHSHIAIRNALSKYQFLPRQERAFITRVCEGTLEYRILIDYIIDSYSKVTVDKMKPVIREILRSAVYQIKFMDSVPDSAVCNEAVKLAQRKGFYNLKPFVNGVLRTIAREHKNLQLPSREKNLVRYLSVRYSMPENTGKQMAGRLRGRENREDSGRFSERETGDCAVPYTQVFSGRDLSESDRSGCGSKTGTISSICLRNFKL